MGRRGRRAGPVRGGGAAGPAAGGRRRLAPRPKRRRRRRRRAGGASRGGAGPARGAGGRRGTRPAASSLPTRAAVRRGSGRVRREKLRRRQRLPPAGSGGRSASPPAGRARAGPGVAGRGGPGSAPFCSGREARCAAAGGRAGVLPVPSGSCRHAAELARTQFDNKALAQRLRRAARARRSKVSGGHRERAAAGGAPRLTADLGRPPRGATCARGYCGGCGVWAVLKRIPIGGTDAFLLFFSPFKLLFFCCFFLKS